MKGIAYTMEKPFLINTEQQAAEVLHYFNGFHDGFIKRIMLESNDCFTQDNEKDIMSRGQIVSNEVMLKVDIAHYNYGAGEPPVNRHVCLLFKDFYDINFNVKNSAQTDWTIKAIKMNGISRPLDTDPNYSMKLIDFILERPVYDPAIGWSYVQESLFKFTNAAAWEEDWELNQ